ncbi:hypothetical protein C1Y63_01115 [Corynebacterium sp. 13CS0277]|uniref:hypothetical protein n=1 Tax=Corynebacterium sp. 13CS0277 TaxID=2071994 RepID=UPI000D462C54|nr:hypothetical protein [Corynebacterium sp. 13CS0277]PRQ12421.1 hypothetical protein C1Y63_01115 [Corynebacterium sp. 13CS0277]
MIIVTMSAKITHSHAVFEKSSMPATAITGSEFGHLEEATLQAAKWILKNFPSEERLLLVADASVREERFYKDLAREAGFKVNTFLKNPPSSFHGAVLAVHVNGNDIFNIPHRGATAVAVTPWGVEKDPEDGHPINTSGLQPWAVGTSATVIGGQPIDWRNSYVVGNKGAPQVLTPLPAEAVERLDRLSMTINLANPFSSYYEKRDIVGTLMGIRDYYGSIDPLALEAWSWSQDWPNRRRQEFKELAQAVKDYKKLQANRKPIKPIPFNPHNPKD